MPRNQKSKIGAKMEEMLLKLMSDHGASFVLLVCGIIYLARERKLLENKGIKVLEEMNANLEEFSKMQEFLKKIDTQEFVSKMDSLVKSIDELKGKFQK